MKNEKKTISNAIKLISMRKGAIEAFMPYRDQILNNGPLNEKERFLIGLATAVAAKSAKCTATQAKNAKEAGASDDEIVQTLLIVGLVLGNSPLNQAFSSIFDNL